MDSSWLLTALACTPIAQCGRLTCVKKDASKCLRCNAGYYITSDFTCEGKSFFSSYTPFLFPYSPIPSL
jgi:hypothetical protein